MNDEDIEDCKVFAQVDGKSKVVHLFDESTFATRFVINVGLDEDGHPFYDPLKEEAVKLLKNRIISRKEDV